MKIFVNNIPNKPEECLFAVKNRITELPGERYGVFEPITKYRCNVNGKQCDLDFGKNCNKLRCIF